MDYDTFDTFNTSHQTFTTFTPEPNSGRGTISLLWQCLTTIVLCTYTVIHFDVPPCAPTGFQKFRKTIKWVLISIFVPEILLSKSYMELCAAWRLKHESSKLFRQKEKHLSLKQAFFISTDGVAIEFLKEGEWVKFDYSSAFWAANGSTPEQDRQVEKLFDHLSENNQISDDKIDAMSHVDVFSKTVTCIQTAWTGVQIIARLVQRLDISLLEVMTASFIIMALITYANWYFKPCNIGLLEPIRVAVELPHVPAIPPPKDQKCREKPQYDDPHAWQRVMEAFLDEKQADHFKLPFFSKWGPRCQRVIAICLVAAIWLAFTAVHLLAWRYDFPTLTETWMWRVAAIYIGAGPLLFVALSMCYAVLSDEHGDLSTAAAVSVFIAVVMVVLAYVFTRVFILVEPFISLRWAPVGIYDKVVWTAYWPHVGP